MSDELTSWNDAPASAPLTLEALDATFAKIVNAPIVVCGVTHPHMVSPSAGPGSWTLCANCFRPVHLPADPQEAT